MIPIAYIGKWGQKFVYCPVCGFVYKEDGVAKHIYSLAKNKDKAHLSHYLSYPQKNMSKNILLK